MRIQKIGVHFILFALCFLFMSNTPLHSPQSEIKESTEADEAVEVNWHFLTQVKYSKRYVAQFDYYEYRPVFNDQIKALHGKEVIIEGFVIPFDSEGEALALSANPFAACFFCGNASPASVLNLQLKDKRKKYKTDDFKKFKGTLYLRDDPNDFYYYLVEASEV